jgi:hypothetical protein
MIEPTGLASFHGAGMLCSFCMILNVTTGVGGTSTLTGTEFKEKHFCAVF